MIEPRTLVDLGLVLVLVLIGGAFAAVESALVSLRARQLTALENRGSRGALVAAVTREPDRLVTAAQIGVTVAVLSSAAYAGSSLVPGLADRLQGLGFGENAAQATAVVCLTVCLAYASLVLGDLVPRRLALQKAAGVSLSLAPGFNRFATLMRPVIWLVSGSTRLLVRLVGGDPDARSAGLTHDDLGELVSTHPALEDQQRRILTDVFAAGGTRLEEVMRPRGDVSFIDGRLAVTEAARLVQALPYSRHPVTGNGFDDVLGFLHVRDLLGVQSGDPRRVRDIARPALMVPRSKLILPTLALMQQEGIHLAVVIDEYGGTDGIVTLEDLVEELVGDIRDEHDVDDRAAQGDPADVAGVTSLQHFAETTGIHLHHGSYETVAGYVIAVLGHIPRPGERVPVDGGTLEVGEVVASRIKRLTLHRHGQ